MGEGRREKGEGRARATNTTVEATTEWPDTLKATADPPTRHGEGDGEREGRWGKGGVGERTCMGDEGE